MKVFNKNKVFNDATMKSEKENIFENGEAVASDLHEIDDESLFAAGLLSDNDASDDDDGTVFDQEGKRQQAEITDASLYYNSMLQHAAQYSAFSQPPYWNINCFQLPQMICDVGPFDIVELKFFSLHPMPGNRSTVRIIGVAAGESLHNLYRIIMTALGQQEDRARLVFHCWIFNDGTICGSGPRYREPCKSMCDDKQVFLNHLPLAVGYKMEFVFGKCLYQVSVEDVLLGMTDENDLIWLPRLIDGSCGESPPFDLCYSPSLFACLPSRTEKQLETSDDGLTTVVDGLVAPSCSKVETSENTSAENNKTDGQEEKLVPVDQNQNDQGNNILIEEMKKNPHLCAKYTYDRYLTAEELDAINKLLISMKFIRQNSSMKTGTRRVKAEAVIPDIWKRMRWFRFSPRRFFYLLWSEQASGQTAGYPDRLPSSLNASTNRVYGTTLEEDLADTEYLRNDECEEYQPEFITNDDVFDGNSDIDSPQEQSNQPNRMKPHCESRRYRRRKMDALAALECFATSSLYHPYYGYAAAIGPRVRVSKREASDHMLINQFDDCDVGQRNMLSSLVNEGDDYYSGEDMNAEIAQEDLISPIKEKKNIPGKKKRGRPRKDEVKNRDQPVTVKRKRGRPRKYPLPLSSSSTNLVSSLPSSLQQSVDSYRIQASPTMGSLINYNKDFHYVLNT